MTIPSMRSFTIALCLSCACGGDAAPRGDSDPEQDAGAAAQPDAASDAAPSCSPGTQDCGCAAGGVCAEGLLCDERLARCRVPTACDGRCAEHQLCTVVDGKDAVCESACEEGYRWDTATSSCLVEPSCDPRAPGSIVQRCAYENRSCADDTGTAACGACLPGASLSGGSCVATSCATLGCQSPQVCVAEAGQAPRCGGCEPGYSWSEAHKRCFVSCYDGGLACRSDEVCVEGDGVADASCKPRTGCELGEVENHAGACLACTQCYDHAGATPVPYPGVTGIANGGRQLQGQCVCTLEDGYFQSELGSVLKCDGDGDRWVTRRFKELGARRSPFAREARCTVLRIDRFVLRSDDGADASRPPLTGERAVTTRREVTVAELARMHDLPETAYQIDENVAVVELVENEALDEAKLFATRYDPNANESLRLRPYGGERSDVLPGRFGPRHANPLTKVCNHDFDDFNMDAVADAEQAQGTPFAQASGAVFFQMAYFVELAHGAVEKNADNSFHAYVISERPRVRTEPDSTPRPHALPFPVASSDADAYAETCMRSRDTNYPGIAAQVPSWARVGFDFARFQCSAAAGGCSIVSDHPDCADAATAPPWCRHVAYDGRHPEYHESLEVGGGAGWDVQPDRGYDGGEDGLWPGMNHHSQFKCQSASSTLAAQQTSPNRVLDLDDPQGWKRFACRLDPASPESGEPRWDCEQPAPPRTASSKHNYWAAVVYRPNSSFYERGCIDEHLEWGFACGAWSGRTSTDGKPFREQALASGRFTCAGDCTRQGMFLSTESGGMCCYGDLQNGECTEHNYDDPGQRSLLCAVDASAASAEVQTCAQALGDFVWARDEGDPHDDPFDPNVLLWADVEEDTLRGSVWACGADQTCPLSPHM